MPTLFFAPPSGRTVALLPAKIPGDPKRRSDIVPTRLARNVGPLFGVAWDDGPFAPVTWVCDVSLITLSEIARGAPLPTRAQAAAFADQTGDQWQIIDRIGLSGRTEKFPNEIPNVTLCRFGPDTKAAVLLTAVNRLLEPVHQAIEQVVGRLMDADGVPLCSELRLVGWLALIIETFRSQPALVSAGIKARSLQRALSGVYRLPEDTASPGLSLARCETGSPDRLPSLQPDELDVVDASFNTLRLDGFDDLDPISQFRRGEVVELLLRHLCVMGDGDDTSHLWISERQPGQLAIEALIPSAQSVQDLAGLFGALGAYSVRFGSGMPMPRIPALEQFTVLPLLTRRALLIALLGVIRYVSSSNHEYDRAEMTNGLSQIGELARLGLPSTDPARSVARCWVALMTVERLRIFGPHDGLRSSGTHNLFEWVMELLDAADGCLAAHESGLLDPGAAAEILGAVNSEVNSLRLFEALIPADGLPTSARLDEWLRSSWHAYLDMLCIDAVELDSSLCGGGLTDSMVNRLRVRSCHHLHNYATFLSGHPDSAADLRAAVTLFRHVVIPTREMFVERVGRSEMLRHSLTVATCAASGLAAAAMSVGDNAAGRAWSTLGLTWIRRPLSCPILVNF